MIFKYSKSDKYTVLIQFQTIFQHEKLEQLEKLNQQKTLLLNQVSHDLKSPIHGNIYVIEQISAKLQIFSNKDKKLLQNLEFLLSQQYYMLNIIQDIADFDSIYRDELKIDVQVHDLQQIINDVQNTFEYMAINSEIKFQIKVQSKDQIIIQDSNRIKQIIMNLLTNALKFSVSKVQLLITQKQQEQPLFIQIIDDGIGIPTSIIDQLQQPYKTFNQGQMNPKGTGLGLYNSSKICQKLGPNEKILIQSDQDKGSTFSFYIFQNLNKPQQNNDLIQINHQTVDINEFQENSQLNINEEINEKSQIELNKKLEKKFKIILMDKVKQELNMHNKKLNSSLNLKKSQDFLVDKKKIYVLSVDDTSINQTINQGFIQSIRFKNFAFFYIRADTEEEGIKIFKERNKKKSEQNINIIIMDCVLPQITGYEASQQIKQLIKDQFYVDCQIIGFSADSSNENIIKCFQHHMNGFLGKPITKKEFQQKIIEQVIYKQNFNSL